MPDRFVPPHRLRVAATAGVAVALAVAGALAAPWSTGTAGAAPGGSAGSGSGPPETVSTGEPGGGLPDRTGCQGGAGTAGGTGSGPAERYGPDAGGPTAEVGPAADTGGPETSEGPATTGGRESRPGDTERPEDGEPADTAGTGDEPGSAAPRSPSGETGPTAAEQLGWGPPERTDDFDGPLTWARYATEDGGTADTADGVLTLRSGVGVAWEPGREYGRWEVAVHARGSGAQLRLGPDDPDAEGGTVELTAVVVADGYGGGSGGGSGGAGTPETPAPQTPRTTEMPEAPRPTPTGVPDEPTGTPDGPRSGPTTTVTRTVTVTVTESPDPESPDTGEPTDTGDAPRTGTGTGDSRTTGPGTGDSWTTWALEWTPDELVAYVDGVPRFRSSDTGTLPPGPMHLCLEAGPGGELDVDWAREYAPPRDGGPARDESTEPTGDPGN